MEEFQPQRQRREADPTINHYRKQCRFPSLLERDVQAQASMVSNQLRSRVKQFAVRIVNYVKRLSRAVPAQEIGRQLVRAGTGISANYHAAGRARSRKEFIAKLGLVLEEGRRNRALAGHPARHSNREWSRAGLATRRGKAAASDFPQGTPDSTRQSSDHQIDPYIPLPRLPTSSPSHFLTSSLSDGTIPLCLPSNSINTVILLPASCDSP